MYQLQPIEIDAAEEHPIALLHNGKPSKKKTKEERFREWRAVAVSTKT